LKVIVKGRRASGVGAGRRYVLDPYYYEALRSALGCNPYPGTLNIVSDTDWRRLASTCRPRVIPGYGGREPVLYWYARTSSGVRVLVLRPLASVHEPNVLEIVSCVYLESSSLELEVDCDYEPPYTSAPREWYPAAQKLRA